MEIDIGIADGDRKKIADGLSHLLADTYTLYLKTHNYHWNVEGPMFNTLHVMFLQQYTEMSGAVDVIAERIRALGYPAPGSYSAFARLSSIVEESELPDALTMVANLVKGHEAVLRRARGVFGIADLADDEATADVVAQRLQIHEKTAWMLRSLLARN